MNDVVLPIVLKRVKAGAMVKEQGCSRLALGKITEGNKDGKYDEIQPWIPWLLDKFSTR
jgi:hypothetical protein